MYTEDNKQVLLTGDRPTGDLHLGHYVGSLKHRLELQNTYTPYIIIADYHMLTTKNKKEDIAEIDINVHKLMKANLAVGLDPHKVTFYLQSAVQEVAEINLLLSMFISVPRLQRIPSLKDMAKSGGLKEMPLGLLAYPVLQSADILLPRAHIVPVGKDNEAHVEVTRELARKFNNNYGELFPEPRVLIGNVQSLVGTDGNAKMSKSLNNSIDLFDDAKTVEKKVMSMYTDPNRVSADVPGKVEGNPVFIYHKVFNPNKAEVADLEERYTKGKVGDVEVKQKLAKALNNFLDPIRERGEKIEQKKGYVEEIVTEGTLKVREVAKETVVKMRKLMGLTGVWNRLRRKAEKYKKTQ